MSYLIFFIFACKETIEPSDIWEVTVTGTGSSNPCIESMEGFEKSYQYALYYDGSFATIKIKDEDSEDFVFFATGEQRGYLLEYASPTYLEESPNGNFSWQIEGESHIESAGLSTDSIPDELDWYGTELLTVVSSENDSIPEGCEYEMSIEGVVQ